jgi:8-oxo-dGTP diphosphatase
MSEKIDVVAAMIQKGDQILIAKRCSPPKAWEFPGGKVEKGEGKAQALIREIKEELAVQIKVGQHIGQSDVLVGTTQIVMDLFACSLLEGEPQNLEHEALKWIKPTQLNGWDWAPADIPLLPLVEEYFGAKDV